MDSKDNFLNKLGSFIKSIDTDYLIGISNKGTVKRAEKDLGKLSNVTYEVKDENIEFKFEDTVCSIGCDIKNYKCSCPSRSICKHVIMGYLYIMKNSGELFKNQNLEEVKEDKFASLKEISAYDIKKKISEKSLNNIINRIEFGINFEIKEGVVVEVKFKDEGISVKFLGDIENSICSCKAKDFCSHKAEALILYKLKKGYLTLEELKKLNVSVLKFDEENLKKASIKIKAFVEDILITGLSRAPITTLDNLNNLAIICHNYELPNFEKSVRDVREEFLFYFKKNAAFDKERLLNKLTALYTKASALSNTKDMHKLKLLIGEFKSSYYEIPPIELQGFAAEKWTSNSGYAGITYYFMQNGSGKIYTYTNSIPTYYDFKTSEKALADAPWGLNCKVCELSNISIKLINGKINDKYRISSSSETKGTIIGKSYVENLNLNKIAYDNWQELLENIFLNNNNDEDENYNLVFLDICKFGRADFNDITQQFLLPIYDKENNTGNIAVKFSSSTKNVIRRLERLVKYNKANHILGRVYVDREGFKIYPISYYDREGEILNLTL